MGYAAWHQGLDPTWNAEETCIQVDLGHNYRWTADDCKDPKGHICILSERRHTRA